MSKKKIIVKTFLTVFCVLAGALLANAESCSTAGQVQYKYTAGQPDECSYKTQTRTCCAATGAWSDWGGSCPSCSSSQCWNGSICVNKEAVSRNCSGNVTNATGGTQTRAATCINGSGWSYGSWTGTCTCKSGYEWNGSSCEQPYCTYLFDGVKDVGSCDTLTSRYNLSYSGDHVDDFMDSSDVECSSEGDYDYKIADATPQYQCAYIRLICTCD